MRFSRTSTCSSSRKRSTRPCTRTRSPRSKRPPSRSASRNTRAAARGPVAQLQREVRRPGPRRQPVLARARVDAGDLVAGAQRAQLCDGHADDDGCAARTGAAGGRPLPWSGMQPLRWDRRRTGFAHRRWCAPSRAGTTPASPPPPRSAFLGASLQAERFAVIDPEEFVDFQATRPTVRLSGGRHRVIEWPDIEVHEARVPRAPRDLVILTGPEPAYRWRTFCATVIELAEALGVQMVVTTGALLADVPHSRPVNVTAFATDDSLVERLQLDPRPTRGRPGSSGCCTTPARPPACRARRSGRRCRTTSRSCRTRRARSRCCGGSRASSASRSTRPSWTPRASCSQRQVSRAVEMDPDVQAFVEKLERTVDEEEEARPVPAPVRRRARARVPALPAPARQRLKSSPVIRTAF